MKFVLVLVFLAVFATAQEGPTIRELCKQIAQKNETCMTKEEGLDEFCEEALGNAFFNNSKVCVLNMDTSADEIPYAKACCCCDAPEPVPL